MQIEVFGMKMRVEVIVLSMVVGAVIGCNVLCSCAKINVKEGMQMLGSAIDYKMGAGVKNSWDTRPTQQGPSVAHRAQNHDSYSSSMVSPDKALDFFADTEFKQECCGSTYSSSTGCACMSTQQVNYLNTRGGNRTHSSEM